VEAHALRKLSQGLITRDEFAIIVGCDALAGLDEKRLADEERIAVKAKQQQRQGQQQGQQRQPGKEVVGEVQGEKDGEEQQSNESKGKTGKKKKKRRMAAAAGQAQAQAKAAAAAQAQAKTQEMEAKAIAALAKVAAFYATSNNYAANLPGDEDYAALEAAALEAALEARELLHQSTTLAEASWSSPDDNDDDDGDSNDEEEEEEEASDDDGGGSENDDDVDAFGDRFNRRSLKAAKFSGSRSSSSSSSSDTYHDAPPSPSHLFQQEILAASTQSAEQQLASSSSFSSSSVPPSGPGASLSSSSLPPAVPTPPSSSSSSSSSLLSSLWSTLMLSSSVPHQGKLSPAPYAEEMAPTVTKGDFASSFTILPPPALPPQSPSSSSTTTPFTLTSSSFSSSPPLSSACALSPCWPPPLGQVAVRSCGHLAKLSFSQIQTLNAFTASSPLGVFESDGNDEKGDTFDDRDAEEEKLGGKGRRRENDVEKGAKNFVPRNGSTDEDGGGKVIHADNCKRDNYETSSRDAMAAAVATKTTTAPLAAAQAAAQAGATPASSKLSTDSMSTPPTPSSTSLLPSAELKLNLKSAWARCKACGEFVSRDVVSIEAHVIG